MRKKNDKLKDHIEATAQEIVDRMTPREIGLSVYPKARPVPLGRSPKRWSGITSVVTRTPSSRTASFSKCVQVNIRCSWITKLVNEGQRPRAEEAPAEKGEERPKRHNGLRFRLVLSGGLAPASGGCGGPRSFRDNVRGVGRNGKLYPGEVPESRTIGGESPGQR